MKKINKNSMYGQFNKNMKYTELYYKCKFIYRIFSIILGSIIALILIYIAIKYRIELTNLFI